MAVSNYLPRNAVISGTAGGMLALACFSLFSASGALSPHVQFPDPEVFISWGPYKYVRNPMTHSQ